MPDQTAGTDISPANEMRHPAVHRVDAYDVPTFWVPSGAKPAAGLVFRVGRSTETAPVAGITHLIKHIVMSSAGQPAHGRLDPTGPDVTGFSFEGEPALLEKLLSDVSLHLSVPPLEGFEIAKEAVSAESADWRPGAREQILRLRHGATGLGGLCLEEFATRKAGHKQVSQWAGRFLHRANAAMWISGPMLDNVRLRLVNGVRPSYDPHLLAIPTPGAAYGSDGHVAFSMVAPHSHAIMAAAQLAQTRARNELCTARNISESIMFTVERLDAKRVELIAIADARQGRDDEVARCLMSVLDKLANEAPGFHEMNGYRDSVATRYLDPGASAELVVSYAVNHITGATQQDWPEVYNDLALLDGASVSAALAEAMQTMLMVGHRSCGIISERFEYVGNWVPKQVPGARVHPVPVATEKAPDRDLWFGPDGLTIREGERFSSMLFSECVLLLRDDNGYRELISENGARIVVMASAWERGQLMTDKIDREIPPERTLIMDEGRDRRGGHTGPERRRWER